MTARLRFKVTHRPRGSTEVKVFLCWAADANGACDCFWTWRGGPASCIAQAIPASPAYALPLGSGLSFGRLLAAVGEDQ